MPIMPKAENMKVVDYIVSVLAESGIDTVFGQIGGFNADFVDAIARAGKQKFVLNFHEQAAGFAANALAMVKETIGVATSSGAPSSCNLLPGIANAFFDSVPCVFIVGSVHSKSLRKSKEIRQNAFEEIDMVSMVAEITKHADRIMDPSTIRYHLERALYFANDGRKGPVLLDLPYDVARAEVDISALKGFEPPEKKRFSPIDREKIVTYLKAAARPVILLGGGSRSETSREALIKFLEKVPIPVVASLCGLDSLQHDHPCFSGFIGHYGNRYANFALANSDCLIVLGSRLDERQIAGDKAHFAPKAKIIRVDIDAVELGRNLPEDVSIYGTVEYFLQEMLKAEFGDLHYSKWHRAIEVWKQRYSSHVPDAHHVDANNFLHHISQYLPDEAVICADVGQNQMFTAQSLRLRKGMKLLNSSGYGTMGYSLPAAIGAAYAKPEATVISVNGDGGLQMNLQELQAVKRDRLPIKIIVLNNNCLGMIRRLQERIYDNRTTGSVSGYECPDYRILAQAYHLNYVLIDEVGKYAFVEDALKGPAPTLIEVALPENIINNPEPGAAIDLQTPLLSEQENDKIKSECIF